MTSLNPRARDGRRRPRPTQRHHGVVCEPRRKLHLTHRQRHAPQYQRQAARPRLERRGTAAGVGSVRGLCHVWPLHQVTAAERAEARQSGDDALGRHHRWGLDIRSEEREKGNADMLRLPPLALDILNSQVRVAGNPHVFAGRGGKAFNSFSENVDALRAKLPAEMRDWTLHDLRRTSRSLLSRAGVLPHVSERVLGHVMPGVEGVYDRHHYQQEKADALAALRT